MKIYCDKNEFAKLIVGCYETRIHDMCNYCPLAEYCEDKFGIEQLVELKDVSYEPTVIYRTPSAS